MLRRTLLLAVVVCLVSGRAAAFPFYQDNDRAAAVVQERATGPEIEYGSPADLRAATRVWIYTGMNVNLRNAVIEKLRKRMPGLNVVEDETDSDVQILMANSSQTVATGTRTVGSTNVYVGVPMSNSRTFTDYAKLTDVSVAIVKRVAPNRVRVMMNYDDSYEVRFDKFADRFVDMFEKAYRQANAK